MLRTQFEIVSEISILHSGGPILVSHDGEYLFSMCGESVLVLHAQSGLVLHKFNDHSSTVVSMAVSRDSLTFAYATANLQVQAFDLKILQDLSNAHAGEERNQESVEEDVSQQSDLKNLKWTEIPTQGKRLAVSVTLIKQWAAAQNTRITTMAFSPDGVLLCTACGDGSAKVWNLRGFQLTQNITCGSCVITRACFVLHSTKGASQQLEKGASPSSTEGYHTSYCLSIGNVEGHVTVWDIDKKRKAQTISAHVQTIECLKEVPSETWFNVGSCSASKENLEISCNSIYKYPGLFIASLDRKITFYTRKNTKSNYLPAASFVVKDDPTAFAFSVTRNHKSMFMSSTDGTIVRYNLDQLPTVSVTYRLGPDELLGESFTSLTCMLNPICDGRDTSERLCAVSLSHNILILDAASGTRQQCIMGYTDQIYALSYLKDENRIAMVNNSPVVQFFSPGSNLSTQSLVGHSNIILCLSQSPDGRFLATGSKDHTIRIWDRDQSYMCTAICTGHTGEVSRVAFSRSEGSSLLTLLSASEDECFKIWILTSLRKHGGHTAPKKMRKSSHDIPDPVFTTSVLKASELQTSVRPHAGGVFAVAWAPGDRFFATGGKDKCAVLWTWDGAQKGFHAHGKFLGHRRPVYDLAFSPIEKHLATASSDKTVKIFNISDFTCLRTIQTHESTILSVQYISQGLQLLTTSADGFCSICNVVNGTQSALLDKHEDQLWAACVLNDGERFFTAGADATIVEWKDVTAQRKQEESEKRKKCIEETQELQNCLREHRYKEAFHLSIALKHPRHLSLVLSEWQQEDEIVTAITELSREHLYILLEYCRDFLLISKKAHVGHFLLECILSAVPPNSFREVPQNVQEIMEQCYNSSSKHYNKLQSASQEIAYLNFLYASVHKTMCIEPKQ